MGATQSMTKSPIDIVNSTITEVSTSVINKHSTTVSGSQKITLECTDKAFAAATAACSADTQQRNAMAVALANINPTLSSTLLLTKPESCSLCSAENINQNMNIAINVQDIKDNTIANDIQAQIKNKVEDAISNKTVGGIGMTDSQVDTAKSFKNYIENKFKTEIVNETLNNFAFSQEITSTNQKVSNVNQTMVASAIGSAIVKNASDNGVSFTADTDTKQTVVAETEGPNPLDIFGGIGAMISMVIGAIGLIFLLFIFIKIIMSSGGGSGAQQGYSTQSPVDQYGRPVDQVGAPMDQVGAPVDQYGRPVGQFGAPVDQYGRPVGQFGAPVDQYGRPMEQVGAPY